MWAKRQEGKNRLSQSLGCIAMAVVCSELSAQDSAATGIEDLIVEQILVTGSRIARTDSTTPSPMVSFDIGEIAQYREQNLEDFLNNLPQVTPDYGRATNNPGDGSASVNLRGLGRSRALVLLNGRRLAPSGTGSAINLNAIPASLIDRIDVTTGGASAVYGADAVAGAVNLVTRSDLDGLTVNAQADAYGEEDGQSYNASITGTTRFANGRGLVTGYFDFLKRRPLLGGDRDFTATVVGENRNNGTLQDEGSFSIPQGIIFAPLAQLDGATVFPVFNQDGSIRGGGLSDAFNFALDNYIQTPLERESAGLFLDFELNDRATLFSELLWSDAESDRQLAATPARLNVPLVIESDFFADSTREVLRATYDTDGDGIGNALLSRRLTELGPRRTNAQTESWRMVAGFNWRVSQSWTLDAFASYDSIETDSLFENDASASRYLQALLFDPDSGECTNPAGGCIPLNIFGAGNISPQAAEFIRIDGFKNQSKSEMTLISASLRGSAFNLPAGPVRVAFGGEYRRNEAKFDPSSVFATGEAIGSTGGFVNSQSRKGKISVDEVFAEMVVPLINGITGVHSLELELGGRYSDYNTSGGSWTWKFGGQWQLSSALRFRWMQQRAIRAPNLEELVTNPTSNAGLISAADDFCLASNDPVGRGLANICLAQGMAANQLGVYDLPPGVGVATTRIIQGNPALQPEVSDSVTAGLSYSPDLPFALVLGFDYFNYEIEDAIAFVESPLALCAAVRDPSSELCGAVVRDATGTPLSLTTQPLNLSVSEVAGVDLHAELTAPWVVGGVQGAVEVRLLATHYTEFGSAVTDALPFVDCAGGFARLCGTNVGLDVAAGTTIPENVSVLNLSYVAENWRVGVRWRWIDKLESKVPVFTALAGQPAPNLPITAAESVSYLDLAGEWKITPRWLVRIGVDNLTETDPPLLAAEALQSNTDPSRYDVFGRRFFLNLEWRTNP